MGFKQFVEDHHPINVRGDMDLQARDCESSTLPLGYQITCLPVSYLPVYKLVVKVAACDSTVQMRS